MAEFEEESEESTTGEEVVEEESDEVVDEIAEEVPETSEVSEEDEKSPTAEETETSSTKSATPPSSSSTGKVPLPEEMVALYKEEYGYVPDSAKQLQAFAKKHGWVLNYKDATRVVKLVAGERVERKKDAVKATIVTDYTETSKYESSVVEEPVPVKAMKPMVTEPGKISVRYKSKTLTLDLPEKGPYPLGELRKDLLKEGLLDETSQLVAFKINGKMVSKYSEDVKTMRLVGGGIRVEIIDPEKQMSKKTGKTHDRLKKEDPKAKEKAAIQKEFISAVKSR
jgi:hypothetical protein